MKVEVNVRRAVERPASADAAGESWKAEPSRIAVLSSGGKDSLLSYGLLNLSAGLEGMIESPSWRPKFKVPSVWSLLGAAGCFMVMLMPISSTVVSGLG